jgi:hypothetical protein
MPKFSNDLITRKHIFYLIILSLSFKILTILSTIFVFNSYIDYFDVRRYVLKSILLLNGQLPYFSFSYEYPILSVMPNIVAAIPSIIFSNFILTFSMYQMIMVLFDIMTAICIYYISLKIYKKEKIAFISGIIYTLSLCAAYTCLTRFDSFPVFLMLFSIFLILYKDELSMSVNNGYFINAMGFFVKIFPIVALPFLILYESKFAEDILKNRLKLNIIIYTVLSLLLFIPFIILTGLDKSIKPYLFATGSSSISVYGNTLTFNIYSWLHDVVKLPVDANSISLVMTIIMGIIIVGLLIVAFKMKKMSELNLIQFICVSLVAVIVFSRFHSPQYFMWITPFFAILVADDIYKILVFFIVQFFAFIEFPIIFGNYYTNVSYVSDVGSYNWYITLLFFTIEYIFIFILLKMILLETIKYNINQYITGET